MAASPSPSPLATAEHRPYQQAIATACQGQNSLIVLPTGLGKTIICALVIQTHLQRGDRVLLTAPTRPLVDQHTDTLKTELPDANITPITGTHRPQDREDRWTQGDILVATPHVVRNDLNADRINPHAWGLLVIDEAHRAIGEYPTVPIAKRFRQAGARILAATASPGTSLERIQTVCTNLGIQHIEARGEWDEDIAPYVDPISLEWVRVGLPNTLEHAAKRLRSLAQSHVEALRGMNLYESRFTKRSNLLALRKELRQRQGNAAADRIQKGLTHVHHALRVLHGVELVETQSTTAAKRYLASLDEYASIRRAEGYKDACRLLDSYLGEHPKMRRCASEIIDHLETHPDARVLVFVETRQTARVLNDKLAERETIQAGLFIGQSGDDGLTQTQQAERLQRFRDGDTNVLVATSVGEEGLDIPNCDLVVFYEAVPSAIRTIQRRGRTGRDGRGRVLVLIARGTSDEAAYWTATKRERQMRQLIRSIQNQTRPEPEPVIRSNPSASPDKQHAPEGVRIDHRTLNGSLARILMNQDVPLTPTNLSTGDLILPNGTAVQRATAEELAQWIQDDKLIESVRPLARRYERSLLLIEGNPYTASNAAGTQAVTTALGRLHATLGVPLLTVPNQRESARLILRMLDDEDTCKGTRSLDSRQRYLLQALPNVSAKLSNRLLERFGSPKGVLEASHAELRQVDGISPRTATAIREVLHEATETPWRSATSPSTPAPASTTRSGTGAEKSAS